VSALILARAQSAIGQGVLYSLGCGGYNPDAASPASVVVRRPKGALLPRKAPFCDCSGLVAWCCGLDRSATVVPGMWGCSTDSIYKDAVTYGRKFVALGRAGGNKLPFDPQPGDLVVYPDYKDHNGKMRQGHTGVIVDHKSKTVIDCGWTLNGINQQTAPSWWNRCTVVRYVGGEDA